MANQNFLLFSVLFLALAVFTGRQGNFLADAKESASSVVENDIGKSRDASRTDDEAVKREEEAIKLDGLNPAQIREIREKSEKFEFQAEVDRMMKLIINSIYRNKEIFLRELISNASDALDKIRMLALTDTHQMDPTHELSIRIKLDKENHMLHISDTGVGMTKDELVNNLGTIAKSGTSEFLEKITKSQESPDKQLASDLIGQFGVGFYSAFLVADHVTVRSKSNNDTDQWVWMSDASSFSIAKDPLGNTLKRGTQISLLLKESAQDFLELSTLKDLVKKYSQFINFNIYLWNSKTESVEEPIEEEDKAEKPKEEAKDADAEVEVDDAKEDSKKPKTKKVEKTTWDWELINSVKPLWLRDPNEIKDEEYNEFYKSMSKDSNNPMAQTHFKAEGEVTFRSLLYIPSTNAHGFQEYGKKHDIKLYVRRVFITDDFKDMMPSYLAFMRGLVDSDDLPLNVSREMLQQNKLLKVIKKKLVRKVLDMIKKLDKETFEKFWKEYSTNIKLGIIEDSSNRTRLSKLLRFMSSASGAKMTSLQEYVERMKDKQEAIYYVAGSSLDEVKKSPFVEKLQKKGFEVLYLTEPVDEYCMQSLPDFDGKKMQNVAKEGLKLESGEKAKEKHELMEKEYQPLLDWLKENALKDLIEKAVISQRLTKSPCALVASNYGWSGNMERMMKSQAYAKQNDVMQDFYANQKKTLEINPKCEAAGEKGSTCPAIPPLVGVTDLPLHMVIKEMLERIKTDNDDAVALQSAKILFDTSIIRGGYMLKDTEGFADRLEAMLKTSLNINAEEMVEDDVEDLELPDEASESESTKKVVKPESDDKVGEEHIEL